MAIKKQELNQLYIQVYKAVSNRLGLELNLYDTPDGAALGYFQNKNGDKLSISAHNPGVNSTTAAWNLCNKGYVSDALQSFGINAPRHLEYISPAYALKIGKPTTTQDEIKVFADKVGFPLFVKPNDGAQGNGVKKLKGMDDLLEALENEYQGDELFLIQQPCKGQREFRVVAAYGRIVMAFGKKPFEVTADGQSSMKELIRAKLHDMKENNEKNMNYSGIKGIVQFMRTKGNENGALIPEKGRVIQPLPVANVSQGATIEMVDLERVDAQYTTLFEKVCKDMNLNYVGADLMCDSMYEPGEHDFIELNKSPGFGLLGDENFDALVDMYEDVISTYFEKLPQPNLTAVNQYETGESVYKCEWNGQKITYDFGANIPHLG